MTLTEARNFLRSELLAVAAIVVPDQTPAVTQDVGPVSQGALPTTAARSPSARSRSRPATPTSPDPEALISFAAETLEARGWKVETEPAEDGKYRVTASRDGYDLTVDARSTDWRITFTGQTPYVRRPVKLRHACVARVGRSVSWWRLVPRRCGGRRIRCLRGRAW